MSGWLTVARARIARAKREVSALRAARKRFRGDSEEYETIGYKLQEAEQIADAEPHRLAKSMAGTRYGSGENTRVAYYDRAFKRSATRTRHTRRDSSSKPPMVYEVVPLPVAGSHKKRFNTYGDAQRYAWECLRRNDRFDLAKIKILGMDGKWREMENWTIGVTGKFKHAYPVDAARDRARSRRKRPAAGRRKR